MTKVDIVSGFLGAGKTTFIKKMLKEAFQDEKIVLIENEFGEIGIDGGFLREAGVEITEMNSGCICCSLVGDFGEALKKVTKEYAPERIIIEPSGVGKLSDVRKAVEAVCEEADLVLNSLVTVADALKVKVFLKNFGEFYKNQLEHADVVVLSRTQKCKEDKLNQAVKLIRECNEHVSIITTPWDDIDGSKMLSVIEKENTLMTMMKEEENECHEHHHDGECGCGHHHHDHDHEHHHDGECGCGHHHDHDHEHHHDGECGCGHHHDHDHEHHHDGECGCGHHHHDHHADEVFTSWGRETACKYSAAKIEEILKTLCDSQDYGMILRAKGMVPDAEGIWTYFDMVPGEYEIRGGQPDYTGRICVIGSQLKEDKLAELFEL